MATHRVHRSASMVETEGPPLVDLIDLDQSLQAGTCPLCVLCDARKDNPDLLHMISFASWKYAEISALVDRLKPVQYQAQMPLNTKTEREVRLYFYSLVLRIAEYAEQWGDPIRLSKSCDDIRAVLAFWQLHTLAKSSVDEKPFVHEGKYGRLFVKRLNELVVHRKTMLKSINGSQVLRADEAASHPPFFMAHPPTYCVRHAAETLSPPPAPLEISGGKGRKTHARQPLAPINTDGTTGGFIGGVGVGGEYLPVELFTVDERKRLAGLSSIPTHLLERYISYRKSISQPRSPDPPALAPSTPVAAAAAAGLSHEKPPQTQQTRSKKRAKHTHAPPPAAPVFPVTPSPMSVPPPGGWYNAPSPAPGYGTPGPIPPPPVAQMCPIGWMGPVATPSPMVMAPRIEQSPKNNAAGGGGVEAPSVTCAPCRPEDGHAVEAAGHTARVRLTMKSLDRTLTSIQKHFRKKFANVVPMQPNWGLQLHRFQQTPPMSRCVLQSTTISQLMAFLKPPDTHLVLFYSWGPDPPETQFTQHPPPPPPPMPMPTADELGQGGEGWELAGTDPVGAGGFLDLDLSLGGLLDGQVSLGLSALPPVANEAVSDDEVLSEDENSPKAPHPTSPQDVMQGHVQAQNVLPQMRQAQQQTQQEMRQQNKGAVGGSYPDVSVDGFGLQLHGNGQPAGRQSGMGSVLRSNSISFKQPDDLMGRRNGRS